MIKLKIILLKDGIVYDLEKDRYDKKDIIIKDGKIVEIVENLLDKYENMEIIELNEKFVFLGFIDCYIYFGIIEECIGKIGVDNNEILDFVIFYLNGIDVINLFDIVFKDVVKFGIICVMSGFGSNNVVGGRNVVIKIVGIIIDKMIVKNLVGFKVFFGENLLSIYGINDKCLVIRMGSVVLIRELFMRIEDYIVCKENNNIKERDIRLEVVIFLLKGEILLRVYVYRVDDIVIVIRIVDEFNISKMVIEYGIEVYLVKFYLKEKNVLVVYGFFFILWIKMELKERRYVFIVEFFKEGVKIVIIIDYLYNLIDCLRIVVVIVMV